MKHNILVIGSCLWSQFPEGDRHAQAWHPDLWMWPQTALPDTSWGISPPPTESCVSHTVGHCPVPGMCQIRAGEPSSVGADNVLPQVLAHERMARLHITISVGRWADASDPLSHDHSWVALLAREGRAFLMCEDGSVIETAGQCRARWRFFCGQKHRKRGEALRR